jgi:ferredoxin
MSPRPRQLTVDRIKCDGRGLCAQLLPELIRLDDWGYPIISAGPIPDHLMPLAERAVEDCPVLALAIRKIELKKAAAR